MIRLRGLFFVFLLFPAFCKATGKIQIELISPLKPFKMKVGEPLEIQFKAVSNKSLKYVILLKHADAAPWPGGEGPLTLKAQDLKMGTNKFLWDGASFGWAPSDAPKMGKLKKDLRAAYYLQVLVLETDKPIYLLGRMSNYHKYTIAKLKGPKFFLN